MKFMKTAVYSLSIGFFCFALGAEDPEIRTARFQVGPVYRGSMQTRVRGFSHAQNEQLTSASPFRHVPRSIGSRTEFDDRSYDDGYVNRDPGTGHPQALDPNTTWFWGYDHQDQVDRSAGTLSFTSSGGRQITKDILENEARMGTENSSGTGLALSYIHPFQSDAGKEWDMAFQARGFWNMQNTHRGSTYRERITDRRFQITDTYDVSGTFVPAAPHRGTFDGPFDDPPVLPSPLIPNLPDQRREQTTRTRQWEAANHVNLKVDADFYEFRVGPRFALEEDNGPFRAYAIPTLSLNILQIDARRYENWGVRHGDGAREIIQSWRDTASTTAFMPGIGIEVGLNYDFTNEWGVALHGGYDQIATTTTDIGPNRIKTDMSGFSVGFAIVYTFGSSQTPPQNQP